MMKSYPSFIVYLMVILTSLTIMTSSSNWFFMWVGLELSLFGFLPLFTMNSMTIDGITKYFLAQVTGSAMYLMSFLMINNLSMNMLILSMMMKLGLFPFFQWVPLVMMSLKWMGCLMLSTLQKLGPLMILMIMKTNSMTLIILSAISIMVSSIIGFNQLMLRSLMAYSSINHSSWIVLTTLMNFKMTIMYVIVYFTVNFLLFKLFKVSKSEKVVDSTYNKNNMMEKVILMMTLVGIPPFPIFFLKMNIMIMLSKVPMIMSIIIVSTFISSYFYLTFIIPTLMVMWSKNKSLLTMILFINLIPIMMIIG